MIYLADKTTCMIRAAEVRERTDEYTKINIIDNGDTMLWTCYHNNKKQELFKSFNQAQAWLISELQTDLETWKKRTVKLRNRVYHMDRSIKSQSQRLRLLTERLRRVAKNV